MTREQSSELWANQVRFADKQLQPVGNVAARRPALWMPQTNQYTETTIIFSYWLPDRDEVRPAPLRLDNLPPGDGAPNEFGIAIPRELPRSSQSILQTEATASIFTPATAAVDVMLVPLMVLVIVPWVTIEAMMKPDPFRP